MAIRVIFGAALKQHSLTAVLELDSTNLLHTKKSLERTVFADILPFTAFYSKKLSWT